jgi:hypothetical protein
MSSSKNKIVYSINGSKEETNFKKINEIFNQTAKKKYEEIIKTHPKKIKTKINKQNKNISEIDTYKPLTIWLKSYIKQKFNEDSDVFDTSSQTLANYFSMNFKTSDRYRQKIKNLGDLNIRPDIIGISTKTNKIFFIESKIVSLGVKELGQIWSYSVLADPFQSFLISTKEISKSLLNVYAQNKDKKFLNFNTNKEIIFGQFNFNKGVELFNV